MDQRDIEWRTMVDDVAKCGNNRNNVAVWSVLLGTPPHADVPLTIREFATIRKSAIHIGEYYRNSEMYGTPKLARWLGFDGGYKDKDNVATLKLIKEVERLDPDTLSYYIAADGVVIMTNSLFDRICAVRGGTVWELLVGMRYDVELYDTYRAVFYSKKSRIEADQMRAEKMSEVDAKAASKIIEATAIMCKKIASDRKAVRDSANSKIADYIKLIDDAVKRCDKLEDVTKMLVFQLKIAASMENETEAVEMLNMILKMSIFAAAPNAD
jgi:hypothetical protein